MRYLIFTMLLSCNVFANAGGEVPYGFMSEVLVGGTLSRVAHSNGFVNPDGCGDSDTYVIVLDDSAMSKRLLATILAAHTSNKEVAFWLDGCAPTPWGNRSRPKITSIRIRP